MDISDRTRGLAESTVIHSPLLKLESIFIALEGDTAILLEDQVRGCLRRDDVTAEMCLLVNGFCPLDIPTFALLVLGFHFF